nr:DapH/DapD/GlmU-related protein [Silicimonas algicola]
MYGRKGEVIIEEDVWIGANATILRGVTIGVGATVGAGSVVTKNVDAGDMVAGNPARRIHDS